LFADFFPNAGCQAMSLVGMGGVATIEKVAPALAGSLLAWSGPRNTQEPVKK
jgi:hypothetical protein